MRPLKAGSPQDRFLAIFGSLFPRGEWPAIKLNLLLESLQYRELEAGTTILREGQVCASVPFVIEGSIRVYKTAESGREITLREESYKVLVVPPAEVIPYGTLAKAKQFFEQGGVVAGYGFLPSKSATLGKTSADIAAVREAVWGDAKPGLNACKTSAAGGNVPIRSRATSSSLAVTCRCRWSSARSSSSCCTRR